MFAKKIFRSSLSSLNRVIFRPYNVMVVGVRDGKEKKLDVLTLNNDFEKIEQSPFIQEANWEIGKFKILETSILERPLPYNEEDTIDKIFFVGVGNEEEEITKEERILNEQYESKPNFRGNKILGVLEENFQAEIKENEENVKIFVENFGHFSKIVGRGITKGLYDYDAFTKEEGFIEYDVEYVFDDEDFVDGCALGRSENFCKFLSNLPANICTPEYFCDIFRDVFKGDSGEGNVEVNVRSQDWIVENKFNGLLQVSKGSSEKPKVLEILYMGDKESDEIDFCLVGKGITFDSGGIQLKPGKDMKEMKKDMSGAAIVSTSMKEIVSSGLPVNVVSLSPLSENLISSSSYKPGDVYVNEIINKSIEIEHTDAEGRIILSDALAYASEQYNPRFLFNVATLTGAISVAIGEHTGVYSSQLFLSTLYENVSNGNGDFSWRMPLFPSFLEELESDVADIKNLHSNGKGGSCVGATFLNEFVNVENFLHLDVAGNEKNEVTVANIVDFVKIVSLLKVYKPEDFAE